MTSLAARPARAFSSSLRTKALAAVLLFLGNLLMFCAATAMTSSAQTFTSLYSFPCTGTNCPDGNRPTGGLVQGVDGNFYGTTVSGGTGGVGTVFKIGAGGNLTSLHSFNGSDGLDPFAGLVLGIDGNFYGTSLTGGFDNLGSAFQMTPNGTVSQVYSLCAQQGCVGEIAYAPLLQGTDGNLYGTAQQGGNNSCSGLGVGCGTVFKLTPSGTLTTLYAFTGPDGVGPYAGLTLGADGNLYGTTEYGGTGDNKSCIENSGLGCGTVFRITPSGTLTTIYSFCSQTNCADGYGPQGGLVQAADGNFYGTAHWGGAKGDGTVFRISPGGSLTTLHSFTGYPHDGANPIGGLIQATDGDLYGTTPSGGANFTGGTIYQMSPSGSLTTLYSFCALPKCNDGSSPYDNLLQATDGNLYGTTSMGGNGCNGGFCGTVFKVSMGIPPFLMIQPTSGPVGTPVTILGTNLGGATKVTFNGTPATFTVLSGSEIQTSVPSGASTGVVQVAIPGSTVISNTDFQVVGPIQFVPVTPCRVADTRQSNPIPGGTSRNFTVPGAGGCGIPPSAAAYSLNVTVVPRGRLGYLTIWPGGEIQPNVSTMNSPDGRTKANAAIVPSGNNAVSVYVTDTTDVILDINGYFTAPGSQTYQFYPVPPCRVVDTRTGSKQPQGLGPPALKAKQKRDLPILSSPCLSGVTNPLAYSFNVTVSPNPKGQSLNYLTVWPSDQPQPAVSTLNNPTATVVANAAIVPAASNGDIDVYAYNSTDLIIDIDGYFAAPATGYSLYPATPCRAYDSRNNNGQPFTGERTVNTAGSLCAPGNATAYVFNATVVPSGSLGYLTLWADGQPQPIVSTLNASDGFVTSNMAIVPNMNGSTDAFAGSGHTQLILDISGFFAP